MAIEYSFAEQKTISQEVSHDQSVAAILLKTIPGALAAHSAHRANDLRGTDFWLEHERGTHVSVDVKIRVEDWAVKPEPERADDLALETWSVVEAGKIGWTRDSSKRTDFVLWYWADTGRWCLMPFPMLCAVFQDKWQEWSHAYQTHRQYTPQFGGYHSECVFVPREVVWNEIYRRCNGAVHDRR